MLCKNIATPGTDLKHFNSRAPWGSGMRSYAQLRSVILRSIDLRLDSRARPKRPKSTSRNVSCTMQAAGTCVARRRGTQRNRPQQECATFLRCFDGEIHVNNLHVGLSENSRRIPDQERLAAATVAEK
eukprot:s3140_g6.t1